MDMLYFLIKFNTVRLKYFSGIYFYTEIYVLLHEWGGGWKGYSFIRFYPILGGVFSLYWIFRHWHGIKLIILSLF